MASNPSFLCISPVLLLLILFFTCPSNAADAPVPSPPPYAPVAPESACNATLYPDFCKSFLPHNKSSVNDYCRFSIRQSMSTANKFMRLVNSYLARRSTLSIATIRALEDCRLLAELNIDFFSSTMNTLASTTNTLNKLKTDDLQSLLSATVTNQQTCFDGLHATSSSSGAGSGFDTSLSNGNKLYSVALALFNRGWAPKQKKGRFYVGRNLLSASERIGKHGSLNVRMSNRNREIFESVSGRKLLQTGSNAVVVRDMVTVNPDGTGNFTTINDAIAAAPNKTVISDGYFMIFVVAGIYEEYVNIPKNKHNLMMIGDGINQTIITGNRSVGDGSTTFNSATFIVVGQGFVGINMTIRNTAGPSKGQAVALRSGADLSTFYKCSFEAYQDTLYTHSLRQFYRECDIYGTVDFIFGNAAVVLQNCNIYPRLPGPGQFNALTAQGRTDPGQNTGTSIHNCIIKAAPDLASSNRTVRTYLGRPWKQYSRTVYVQSFIDSVIDPVGWNPWNGDFLSTLYYAEFANTGPGSDTSGRVTWPGYRVINSTEAVQFTIGNFILGGDWLPATGVPFTVGLV